MTDYSQNIFGKSLETLSFSDIEDFFSIEREESNILEFKSFPAKAELNKSLNGIKECITAFLNSQGGVLIWGAPTGEKKPNQKEKVFKGALTLLKHSYTKDRLINEVSFPIQPLPMGIKVRVLQSEADTNIYVFEVQESIYKPHQYDNIYYIRLDGQTVKAPHYIVEALMRRISYPNIQGFVKFEKVQPQQNGLLIYLKAVVYNFSPLQNEENISFTLACPQGRFLRWGHGRVFKWIYNQEGKELRYDNFVDVLHYGTPHFFDEAINFIYNDSERIEITLTFGGKKSPRKWCRYVLDVRNISETDPQSNIIEKEENILFAESIKSSPDEMVKAFLGR